MIDAALLQTAADWCINLSAGWFAAAFIASAFETHPQAVSRRLVIENCLFDIYTKEHMKKDRELLVADINSRINVAGALLLVALLLLLIAYRLIS